ncbi:hypothetical protein M4D51_04445 [Microbacterium sp. p3-SID338]|uniref:hypothetical protein n=1 Tax=unclassified Microbacterium TaxID=2609290 RepID=UPI001E56079A|nr:MULTISPECIES: hypothetical protein [unclassified Microbacterium]MCT1394969.1 hypothetical protein [Microbacterium sp. p3-SID338]
MNKTLTRSAGFWLLIVVSLAAVGVGGWMIAGQVGTMTTTLMDGTATGVEVYVGQSLVVVGAVVLGAGLVGLLLSLGLVAARTLVATPVTAAPVVEQEVRIIQDETIETVSIPREEPALRTADAEPHVEAEPASAEPLADEDQKGSSGSIATATNSSVR